MAADPPAVARTEGFFRQLGLSDSSGGGSAFLPSGAGAGAGDKDFYSRLVRSLLSVRSLQPRGRVLCSLSVPSALANPYNTLHGGAVAAVAEAVALACARAVAGDREFFLGESATSYLSAARVGMEMEVEGRVLRKGKSVIVTSVEFRIKETGRLSYTSRLTFYVRPVASM
ncbi:acyl-coenzyme A thioesterase 13 isoform X1 [Ananas comosus]|uniref:Acyl-coenzyme A thioesterase 13 n=1 Tax=Ananas comosus TaxID=4615 RepID=A0A199V6U0_ANACO|nr:acyl-coenzyme A thioesterase 13 isoform X1 [Ananas comosus]OAY72797.1 Acyl-coenzyme A thioesterase 13 [Ananas comosus]